MDSNISIPDTMVEAGPSGSAVDLLVNNGGKGKTVAVTGANSFIGSHVVKLLLVKGYKVRGTVNELDPFKVDFLKDLPNAKNLTLHKCNLLDEDIFNEVFKGCDCVFLVASPTMKDQREMKSPEDIIDQAVRGTTNVLQACKIARVKSVVYTSSLCAATPKPGRPKILNEGYWADPEVQRKKGSHYAYYAASKTLAERATVEFVAKMPTESAFRLVRICPTFTVGPMLQPTAPSSMERFAAICNGTHHKQIPNRSTSLIDVRDTAAHHVAAYENGHEGRFFSTTEAWPWTLIYNALKFYIPEMRCPEPLPDGMKQLPIKEYNKKQMNSLGVRERSMLQLLGEAVMECKTKKMISYKANLGGFLQVAGYYDLGLGDGRFFMIDVEYQFEANLPVSYTVTLSWLLEVQSSSPTIVELPQNSSVEVSATGQFTFNFPENGINLLFSRYNPAKETGRISVNGTISSVTVSGTCYITYIPSTVFSGTYYTADGGNKVTLAINEDDGTITDYDGVQIEQFTFNPVKREFIFKNDNFNSRLYMNAAAGQGMRLTFVRFNPASASTTGSVKIFFTYPSPTSVTVGPTSAGNLATFAGYYQLNTPGAFVSIVDKITEDSPILVGFCTDGKNASQYSTFSFDGSTLTFPSPGLPVLTFTTIPSAAAGAEVNVIIDGKSVDGNAPNFFSPAPIQAFGNKQLLGQIPNTPGKYSLTIDADLTIDYAKDGTTIFQATSAEYEYNSIEQAVFYKNYVLNFCYNINLGVTCGITIPGESFQVVLFACDPEFVK